MRFPAEAGFRLTLLGLSLALGGCEVVGARGELASAQGATVGPVGQGPAADYPMVLGAPFTVDGELYTPVDTMNYDAVGYAALDDGAGLTAAHRTLPLPSYAEVTSLDSGKTILVRIERRGPASGKSLLALSPPAATLLGARAGTAIRVRRVNPPETERAELRAGRAAADRIATPKSLVEVLRRRLPPAGVATLGGGAPTTREVADAKPQSAPAAAHAPTAPVAAAPQAVSTYPLAGLKEGVAAVQAVTTRGSQPSHVRSAADATAKPAVNTPAKGTIVIQAAAFSSRANADRAARALGGTVSRSGKFFRVQTGPFTSRTEADAALAKVRAAGYSDARVTTAG